MVYNELPAELAEVDVIVVGGGAAASVIASRLADADSETSVLVIERGPNNHNVPTIIHPALYRANFDPAAGTMLYYISAAEEQIGGRSVAVGAGGTLGGGSSVNAAIYGRGQGIDYDSWNTEGWSAKELIPFLKKLETFYPDSSKETHGTEGPTAVSDGKYTSNAFQDDFLAAANRIGYPTVDDVQDLKSGNAVSKAHRWVSPLSGRRQDAAHVYLHPRLGCKGLDNLHVLVESQVSRVLFDEDKRASGVEFRNGGSTHMVKARKLVVVSAGALGTPQILERSGVGSAEVLNNAGVPVVSDLVGVGHDYQDHQMVVVIYNSTFGIEDTVDSVVNGAMNVTQLLESDAGILSWNGIDAFSKLRPTESEVNAFESALRTKWDQDFAQTPEKPLGIIIPMAGILGDVTTYPPDQYISMACYSTYPYSRGSAHITGPGLDDPLDFKTGYLSDTEGVDTQILVWLYKKQRQLARRMSARGSQVSPAPNYGDNSKATDEFGLNSTSDEEPVYSAEDDEAIKQWARDSVGTAFHSMATCKMAPKEKNGVVDANLNVYGVKGLKVADLSIAPENVSGNTMNAALLIGEKAADIFIRELGLDKA